MSLNLTSDGSPTPRKTLGRFNMADDLGGNSSPDSLGAVGSRYAYKIPIQLWPPSLTSQLQGVKRPLNLSARKHNLQGQDNASTCSDATIVDPYKLKVEQVPQGQGPSVVDALLSRLNEPVPHLSSPITPTPTSSFGSDAANIHSSNGSVPITPATDEFPPSAMVVDTAEFQRLKDELQQARNELTRMNQELHTTNQIKSTFDHAMGPSSSDTDYYYKGEVSEQTITQLQSRFNASTRPIVGRLDVWPTQEDNMSEKGDPKNFGPAIWNNPGRQPQYTPGWGVPFNNQTFGPIQPRPVTGQSGYRRNGFLNEPTHFPLDQNFRGGLASNPPSRPSSAFDGPRFNSCTGYNNALIPAGNVSPTMPSMHAPIGMYGSSAALTPYGRGMHMGTRLSPEAAEFSVETMPSTPWNSQAPSESGRYITPVEPVNYRRLLDRNANCDWKWIVDKIICNNDQQASIFLQQKLKVGTPEQKYEIVEAIIAQAYPLMINRFGNFLVQRCFEHGTPDQIVAIAQAIRGNTLNLSMDAFGCHVVQKAFDAVPEEYKATMVHELLRRIPETVIHRYACHVWQKLFELRWSDSPPQIMRYVNEALRGMWHEVALGETGSLVVQNIFENCLEEDKRPCINEVLASIDVIAHGQFGNWCIQHICEHGAPADRNRAIEHILRFATEYSMDQYASKVIEKCLKIGGNEFLDRYLERVCEGRPERPRMPLIDSKSILPKLLARLVLTTPPVAGDQFGNYLIQYILTNSSAHHRELVASHVRKHMVSLRGSKYGSRVAMLCCNPALATRPGPPAGMQLNRYGTSQRSNGYNAFRA
ncbi:ARM repeat-containing protein [Westerdykella ornata]|uniref:ARM repeat-containing protein n=1 Tax=Westerdykella ornata TaxID=318751 RepID=A0A6A6J910_WESOR|nr:ARM repeat-containing protein [Westerdykella ornata]KAF2271699.1 ARM repeat-containing protein [Westerdykella ornata]